MIETNGENHKENDECIQSFTNLRVYKSQTNKYIILVKTKNLNKRKIKHEKLQRNQQQRNHELSQFYHEDCQ